jgi:predicted anti-sigma-YlaC factor YlaD
MKNRPPFFSVLLLGVALVIGVSAAIMLVKKALRPAPDAGVMLIVPVEPGSVWRDSSK